MWEAARKTCGQLDRYLNMYVDLAARFTELGRQPYTSASIIAFWRPRTSILTTARTTFYGVGLSNDVLKKIYHDNARLLLG